MKAQKHLGKQSISKQQIKAIHALKNAVSMDDETYRAMLKEFGNVESSTALSFQQADALIDDLKCKAGQEPRQQRNANRHNNLEGRPGMATPPQLRMIEAMWREVSRAENPEDRALALRSIVKRIAKVSDLRFLDKEGAAKIINALEAMKKRQ